MMEKKVFIDREALLILGAGEVTRSFEIEATMKPQRNRSHDESLCKALESEFETAFGLGCFDNPDQAWQSPSVIVHVSF